MPTVGKVMEYLGQMVDGRPAPVRATFEAGSYKVALKFRRVADFDVKFNFRMGYRPVNYRSLPPTWFIGYDRTKTWDEANITLDLTLIAFNQMSLSGGVELGFSYFDESLPAPLSLVPTWDSSATGDTVSQKFTFPIMF